MTVIPAPTGADSAYTQRQHFMMTLEALLAKLEADPRNEALQKNFFDVFLKLLGAMPGYSGGLLMGPEDFSEIFTKLKRNHLVTENEEGFGDLFVRRSVIEARLTRDSRILDDLDVILSDRRGGASMPGMGGWRKRFGQSGTVAFQPETRARFHTVRAERDIEDCESAFDSRKAERAAKTLAMPEVAARLGADWAARFIVVQATQAFKNALRARQRGRQRQHFKEMVNAARPLLKRGADPDFRKGLEQRLCHVFTHAAALSCSRTVWMNAMEFLKSLKCDIAQAALEIESPPERLSFFNRRYWHDRARQTAATPHAYVQTYQPLFPDFRLRLISPAVGFTAEADDRCLFTPQSVETPPQPPPQPPQPPPNPVP